MGNSSVRMPELYSRLITPPSSLADRPASSRSMPTRSITIPCQLREANPCPRLERASAKISIDSLPV